MPGKINVYNLGGKGVNVVKSAVHLDDGEVTKAQNFQVDPVSSAGGIRKRDGMTKLTGSAMAGAARGIIALPLPDRSALVNTLYTPYDDRGGGSANNFIKSTNGTAWTNTTLGSKPQRADVAENNGAHYGLPGMTAWCAIDDKIYYPGSEAGLPTIHVFDGTTDYKLGTIPRNPNDSADPIAILAIVQYSSSQLLISMNDSGGSGGSGRSRILLMNVQNGDTEQLGPQTDLNSGTQCTPIVFQGRIWIADYMRNGATVPNVRWIRPGDLTWTIDKTWGATVQGAHGFAIFKGLLYLGLGMGVGFNAQIQQRSAAGAWSAVFTGDGTSAENYCGPFVVSRDGLTIYAWVQSLNGAGTTGRVMKSTDGAAWTADYNAGSTAAFGMADGFLDVETSDIYWNIYQRSAGNILVRNASGAGVYATVLTDAALRGPIIPIKV